MAITTHIYPYGSDDTNRDYLIAHHIVKFHEYPLTGPFAAVTKSRNSPTYYYLIAIAAFVKDDPIFLRIINDLFLIITIFIIFKLAEKMFDSKTAMLAAAIFSFNNFSLLQSAFIWQPWVMQPFINLSFLLLLIAYQKKKNTYLMIAVVLFIFALSIHPSALAVLPVFSILLVVILRNQKSENKEYIEVLGISAISFLLFFGPVFIAAAKNIHVLPNLYSSNISSINNINQIIVNFVWALPYFLGGSLFYVSTINKITILLSVAICIVFIYYFFSKKSKQEKIYFLILLSPIFLQLILFSSINIKIISPSYGIHYFTPIYGLFIILFSRAMIFTFKKNDYFKFTGILLLSIYLGFFITDNYKMFYQGKKDFSLKYLNDPAINAIKSDVIAIKNTNKYHDFNFFAIESVGADEFGWKYNATVWAVLERELGTKFVKIDDFNHDGFIQINKNSANYVFLICPAYSYTGVQNNICLGNFVKKHKNYVYSKKVYSNSLYSINLYQKRS